MDERTLRRLLTPFEANVLILAARYRGNLDDVCRALWPASIDENGAAIEGT